MTDSARFSSFARSRVSMLTPANSETSYSLIFADALIWFSVSWRREFAELTIEFSHLPGLTTAETDLILRISLYFPWDQGSRQRQVRSRPPAPPSFSKT